MRRSWLIRPRLRLLVATVLTLVIGVGGPASAITLLSAQRVDVTRSYNGVSNGHLLVQVTQFQRTTVSDTGGSPIVVGTFRAHARFTGGSGQVEILVTGPMQVGITNVPKSWWGCTGGRWNGYCLVRVNVQLQSDGARCRGSEENMPSGEVFYTRYRSQRCHQTYRFNSDPLPNHVATRRLTLFWHEDWSAKHTRLTRH